MDDVTDANRRLARTAAEAFGGKPRVTRYWDDDHKSFVDLLVSVDRPQAGVASYSTIGLSDHLLMKDGKDYGVRVEFVGACGTSFKKFDNIIATAAFCVINSKWFCYPGAIFPDVVHMYKASKTLKHIFFAPPFLWENKLKTMELGDKKVTWLLLVPISDQEMQLAETEGSDKLEELFIEKQIDIFNLNRVSVC